MACYSCDPDEDGINYIVQQLNLPERIVLRDVGAWLEDGLSVQEIAALLLKQDKRN